MRYDNGKIYRITNNIDNMIYIGSTCLPLRKRLYCHKKEQHSGKGQNRRLFLASGYQLSWLGRTQTQAEYAAKDIRDKIVENGFKIPKGIRLKSQWIEFLCSIYIFPE